MNVTFELTTPEMLRFNEGDFKRLGDAELRSVFGEILVPSGGLILDDEETGDFTAFGDELEGMIGALCLAAVPELVAGRPFTYSYRNSPGDIRLIPEAEVVRVEEDQQDTLEFPREKLLPALVDCGSRFIHFLQVTHQGDENWVPSITNLSASEAKARAALGERGAAGTE